MKKSKMKIVCISDTHGQEDKLKNLSGDILIHCGDMGIQNSHQLHIMNSWFGSLDFMHKFCIAGNHDRFLKTCGKQIVKQLFTNTIYLENDGCEVMGLKVWGSPNTPKFNNWSFMYERGSIEAKEIWNKIPEGLDFLITHTMPYQILDTNYYGEHCGCQVLQREVFKKKPRFHVGGHLHNDGGKKKIIDGITFCNVSVLDEEYKLTHEPIILEI